MPIKARQVGDVVFMPLSGGADTWSIFQGIRQQARKLRMAWGVLIRPWAGTPESLSGPGIIGAIAQVGAPGIGELLRESGLPVVNFDGGNPAAWDFPAVIHDGEAVGRAAAGHLLSLGLRHLLVVAPADRSNAQANIRGFVASAAAAGIAAEAYAWPTQRPNEPAGTPAWAAVALDRIAALPKPCGVLVWGLAQPVHLLDLLRQRWQVPAEVAVMATAHDRILHGGDLGVSGVATRPERIGAEAARLLHALLAGRRCPRQVLVEPGPVVAAASTDIVAVDDPLVAAALARIRSHADRRLDVDTLAKAMLVSRRSLQRAFQRVLGHGVRDEILHWRGERALDLLRKDGRSVKELARSLGYADGSHFARALRRSHGLAPGAARAKDATPGS